MKKIITLLLASLTSFWLVNAFSGNCQNLEINWPKVEKINIPVSYTTNLKNKEITWNILKNKNIVYTTTSKQLNYSFKQEWKATIQALAKSWNCYLSGEKNITIYKTIILTFKKNLPSFINTLNLENKGIYLKNVNLNKKNPYFIKIADYIILDQDYAIDFFNQEKNNSILKSKKIIILTSNFKGFFERLIIPYVKDIYNNNIYLYPKKDFLNILAQIIQNQKLEKNYLLNINWEKWKWYLPLSYFTNKLIENWVPVNLIGLTFVALIAILVIAIFRQIIGFSVFGLYTPLIFSILIISFSGKLVLTLFVLAILAQIVTNLITKKVYVLYTSKIALNYLIYTVLAIIFSAILLQYKLINIPNLNLSILAIFFIMPLITKNLIKEDTNIFSKSFLIFTLEFIFITSVLLAIFNLQWLEYLLVAYPDLLWLLIIFTILIGRFSGLQLLEYIRFYPLIKKNIYEEE